MQTSTYDERVSFVLMGNMIQEELCVFVLIFTNSVSHTPRYFVLKS